VYRPDFPQLNSNMLKHTTVDDIIC